MAPPVQGFKRMLNQMWFELYSRDGSRDSSGFEHVFIGEHDTSDGEQGGYSGCSRAHVCTRAAHDLCHPDTACQHCKQPDGVTQPGQHPPSKLREPRCVPQHPHPTNCYCSIISAATSAFSNCHAPADVCAAAVSGFHNWVNFWIEERKGALDYRGFLLARRRQDSAKVRG
jgi:hypothetical protein